MEQEDLLPPPPKKGSQKNISQEEGLLPLPPKKKYSHSIITKVRGVWQTISSWFRY